MQYRQLGKTDVMVSTVALGCWAFVGGDIWGDQDESQVGPTVNAALSKGTNLFDTAEEYGDGRSERMLGRALGRRRDQVLIASKVRSDLSADGVLRACERSLKNLGTDYIDLYQIHWPSRTIPIGETMAALERLRVEGKIRFIGVSNFGTNDMAELLAVGRTDTNQLLYSLLARMIKDKVMPQCVENEISILCYSPLAQGLLTGKWSSADDVPAARARNWLFSSDRPATFHHETGCEVETFEALADIGRTANEIGQSMAVLALAWCLHQPGITSVVAGARNPEQVHENVPGADLELDRDVLDRLSNATDTIKERIGSNLDILYDAQRTRFR